ncbi:MAG: PKD domain-containing protein, partial [Rhodothermales bacterium]|nr:PKD domain-containing protein [Rhodothermales bacterium]
MKRLPFAIVLLVQALVLTGPAKAQELGAEPIDSETRLDPLQLEEAAAALSGVDALPTGFFTEPIAPGYTFNQPVGVTFAPDGRIFVVEKRGRVYIVENGTKLTTPFINLEAEVLNHWDRGLLGFELDPAFDTNGHVYLLYTYDRDGSGDYQRQDVAARLTRYTVSTVDPNVVDLTTRNVLIGQTFAEAIPSCYYSHTIGTLQFGSDGTLLVGAGDGADFTKVDPGGLHPSCFGAGLFPASEDIGAFRSQRLESLAGKILRIDPATGLGLPSNPFYTGNASDNQSRVWARGVRNPYRFSLRKDGSADPADGQPGTLFIGDVGWGTWEDLHTSIFGGENFGWPCYEGPLPHSSYQSQAPAATYCTGGFTHDAPPYYFHHSNTSLSQPAGLAANAIVVGDMYQGYRYPAGYADRLFYADYTRGWIASSDVSVANVLSNQASFGTGLGAVVDIRFDAVSSYLYWVNISDNQVYRLRHDDENAPPVAVASSSARDGYAPLSIQFTGDGSSDPDGDPMTYLWDFGDGQTSTQANPTHQFLTAGVFQVSLAVSDDKNATSFAFLEIAVDNTYPTAVILTPSNGESFDDSGTVLLTATGIDLEDGPTSLSYDWLVSQQHNSHSHSDFFADTGQSTSFSLEQHGLSEEVSFLSVQLIVTDTGGLSDTVVYRIEVRRPDEIDITASGTPTALVTSPTGSGNPNISVIADMQMPDTSEVNPLLHYDTDDGSTKSIDWIGYTYPSERHFSKIIMQQGVQTPAGGWFDSLSVEVR